MTDRVFLLGVGGQKCGTSWLHDVICQSPQADMGFTKEYHIHDAVTLSECARFKDRTLKQLKRLNEQGTPPASDSKLFLRANFLNDPSTYYRYFQERVNADDVCLTGDFTPSYSGLSPKTLGEIKTNMHAHGLHTKVAFLMRDPVERVWSAVRMSRRQTIKKNPGHVFDMDEFEQLRETYRKPSHQLRSNYTTTLTRLEQVFDPADVFVEFYERLFSQDAVDRICAFSGIERVKAELEKQVNPSPKTEPIPDDLAAEIAAHYAGIYRHLADKYGIDTIKSLWSSARFVFCTPTFFTRHRK